MYNVLAPKVGVSSAATVRAVSFYDFMRGVWHDRRISRRYLGIFAAETPGVRVMDSFGGWDGHSWLSGLISPGRMWTGKSACPTKSSSYKLRLCPGETHALRIYSITGSLRLEPTAEVFSPMRTAPWRA